MITQPLCAVVAVQFPQRIKTEILQPQRGWWVVS